MLVLLSLLAALGFAQDCAINTDWNESQKRRECKKRSACKWNNGFEQNGQQIPGTCSPGLSCNSLSSNQCKKNNKCFINWTAEGRPCQDYDPLVPMACEQLSGKKNMKKCNDQPGCIAGSGDRQNKECIAIPADLQDRQCSQYNGKPNKYICQLITKCTWNGRSKQCVLKKKPETKACNTITNRQECNNNPGGCNWNGGVCNLLPCASLDDRIKCNSSNRKCTWFSGFHAKDFDLNKNKAEFKENNEELGNREGTCKDGVSQCSDINVENHCLISNQKFGVDNCFWNPEAIHFPGRDVCSTVQPCSQHTNQGAAVCQSRNNMFGQRCTWQFSGTSNKCMEFACTSDRITSKNQCNKVGCHWHRNKDKRDPLSEGYCDIFDITGRRLMQ